MMRWITIIAIVWCAITAVSIAVRMAADAKLRAKTRKMSRLYAEVTGLQQQEHHYWRLKRELDDTKGRPSFPDAITQRGQASLPSQLSPGSY